MGEIEYKASSVDAVRLEDNGTIESLEIFKDIFNLLGVTVNIVALNFKFRASLISYNCNKSKKLFVYNNIF